MNNSNVVSNYTYNTNIFIKPFFLSYDKDVIYAKKIVEEIKYNILLNNNNMLIEPNRILDKLHNKLNMFIFKLNMEYSKLNFINSEYRNNNNNSYNMELENKIYYKNCVIDHIISLKNNFHR